MFTPPSERFSDMPPLVDGPSNHSPFMAPPPGVSQGGRPGLFDAFPGAAPAQPQNGVWGPPFNGAQPHSAPHIPPPHWGPPQQQPPNSAGNWTFGQPTPPGFGTQPTTPTWATGGNGGYTPWGGYGPWTPAPAQNAQYTPWSAPAQAGPDGVTSGGFFGANGGAGGGGRGTGLAGDWNWDLGGGLEQNKQRKRKSSMKRTISADQGGHTSRPTTPKLTPLQRSISFGNQAMSPFGVTGYPTPYTPWVGNGGVPYPPFSHPDHVGPTNLGRRPRDWRPDYSPRGKLSSYIPSLMGKTRSDVPEFSDPERRTLHPLLQWSANKPPMRHDLRIDPCAYDIPLFTNLTRPHNDIDFAQLTTQPACHMMRLYHPSLPWFIDIKAQHMNGVTVGVVLEGIYKSLLTPITGRHFWNEELTDGDREAIGQAFKMRCMNDPVVVSRGVCQIDFLGRRLVFEGLVRGKNGNWEMKLGKVDWNEEKRGVLDGGMW